MVSIDLNGIFCGWQVLGAWLLLGAAAFVGMMGFGVLIELAARPSAFWRFFEYWVWIATPFALREQVVRSDIFRGAGTWGSD